MPSFVRLLGSRYFLELGLIVAVKIAALTLIYFVFIAPQPRADTSPAAVRARLTDSPSDRPSSP